MAWNRWVSMRSPWGLAFCLILTQQVKRQDLPLITTHSCITWESIYLLTLVNLPSTFIRSLFRYGILQDMGGIGVRFQFSPFLLL